MATPSDGFRKSQEVFCADCENEIVITLLWPGLQGNKLYSSYSSRGPIQNCCLDKLILGISHARAMAAFLELEVVSLGEVDQ